MKLPVNILLGISVFLFSVSLGNFISSLFLWKTPPCIKPVIGVQAGREMLAGKERESTAIEKEGFFLSPREEKKAAVKQQVETVVSPENLKLKGTIMCSECRKSIAIIEDKEAKKTNVVSEGKTVAGFKVVKVLPDKVLLKKNGKEFVLFLFEEEKEHKIKKKVAISEVVRIEREKVMKEIGSGEFLKYINIIPVKTPVEGLKVNYVNRRSFIYELGIRPGDIIVAINDIHIKTPEDSFSAFEQLKSAEEVTVTVFRRGKTVKLRYELK